MQRETTIIGDKEFGFGKVSVLKANSLFLKIQKVISPAIASSGQAESIMDIDIGKAFAALSSNLDDSVMNEIIYPLLKESQTACTSDNLKLDNEVNINKVFGDADGLADFYTLIFEVMKYNFSGFFTKLAEQFGSASSGQKAK